MILVLVSLKIRIKYCTLYDKSCCMAQHVCIVTMHCHAAPNYEHLMVLTLVEVRVQYRVKLEISLDL